MPSVVTVLVADDHPVTRLGMVTVLGGADGVEVVGQAIDGAEALAAIRATRPAVAVLDLRLPVHDALDVLRELRRDAIDVATIVITATGTAEQARLALQLGARGFFRKTVPMDDLIAAVRAVAAGRRAIDPTIAIELAELLPARPLSAREREVLRAMATGASNKEIANELGMTEATARTHVRNVLEKLDATDRTEAVTRALRWGILEL